MDDDNDGSGFGARRKRREPGKPKKPQSIQRYMLWLLSRQDYSEAGMRSKLATKLFTAEEIEPAIQFALQHKFLSDERFAESKARSASVRHGNYRVKRTLMQKGIDEDLAEQQLEALPPEDERAVEVALRKFGNKELTQDGNQRIYRFLASRGFGGKSIKAAMTALKDAAKQRGEDAAAADEALDALDDEQTL